MNDIARSGTFFRSTYCSILNGRDFIQKKKHTHKHIQNGSEKSKEKKKLQQEICV